MSTRKSDPTEESFLKDMENHEVKVLLDNGVYRHLRCRNPKTFNQHFDIVTYPGHLCYSGDMGCFVFSRLDDMFEFFRTDRREEGKLGINRSYWGEKLQAVDRDGRRAAHKRFSEDKFRENVEEVVADWIENFHEEEGSEKRQAFAAQLRESIADEIDLYVEDGEQAAHQALNDFTFIRDGHKCEFHDTWEWDCEDYTYRFTWCCYALAWAIQKYDAMQTAAATQKAS